MKGLVNKVAFLPALMAVFMMFPISSCSKKINFSNSTAVPGAEGSVKIKKDKNNNYSVAVSVKHLAKPNQLFPPRETYVVWMETEHNGTKNIGQINISNSLFSSARKGSLKNSFSFKPTRIFITGEDNADTPRPVGQIVLSTEHF